MTPAGLWQDRLHRQRCGVHIAEVLWLLWHLALHCLHAAAHLDHRALQAWPVVLLVG